MNRVLWICNIMLPVIGQELNIPYSNREGWLSGIFEKVQKEEASFRLGICFPLERSLLGSLERNGRIREGKIQVRGTSGNEERNVSCYAFPENLNTPEVYDSHLEESFRKIYEDFRPDMIHIFGTEFPHALAAARVFGNPVRTLTGIQGLCGEIAKVYMAGLPIKVQNQRTFRDLIRKDSIREQQRKFVRRGENEAELIRKSGNITGRTEFDREGSTRINPGAAYYHMNETMRREFYEGKWTLSGCQEHSIFLGQGDYPLKGMHFVLMAMALLLQDYPDMKLYVAGNSVIGHNGFRERLKLPAYGKYLLELIEKYGLENKVIMLGKMTASQMKERFLKSSLFVCPSVLENSPNTVGEAQLLGVPVAASRAGGIPDMIADEREGLLFPTGDVEAMAESFRRLWNREKDETGLCLAERISVEARRRARRTHDGSQNYARLLEVYREIGQR